MRPRRRLGRGRLLFNARAAIGTVAPPRYAPDELRGVAPLAVGGVELPRWSVVQHALRVQVAERAPGIITRLERVVRATVVDRPELVFFEVRIRIQRLDASERGRLAL